MAWRFHRNRLCCHEIYDRILSFRSPRNFCMRRCGKVFLLREEEERNSPQLSSVERPDWRISYLGRLPGIYEIKMIK